MNITGSIAELRQSLRPLSGKGSIGFFPTMGYMHDGHRSLIRRARQECNYVVVSIFVNPLQFGPNEDYDRYPRDLERDLAIAREEGVDFVFCPDQSEMYPEKMVTTVSIAEITGRLCGASRPGHFDGVATVVSKLFHIVQPDKAYFSVKDAQQVAVITKMVKDLNFPVEIVPCPFVRDVDGLALSSRNVRLYSEEREQATILYKTLNKAKQWIADGITDTTTLQQKMAESIRSQPLAKLDYVEILRYPDLTPIADIRDHTVILALAVHFGGTRLIDNIILNQGRENIV